jgi:hypothetical protein
MLRLLVPMIVLTQLTLAQAAAQELEVRTVDLHGEPRVGIKVRIVEDATDTNSVSAFEEHETESDSNGIATFKVVKPAASGSFKIEANVDPESDLHKTLIARVKTVRWKDKARFTSGFVIPIWTLQDVGSLGDAIVRNPDHVAVVLKYDKDDINNTRVVARFESETDGDVEAWIERWGRHLPEVSSPELARALGAGLAPGDTVPKEYSAGIDDVYCKVERIRENERIARQSPVQMSGEVVIVNCLAHDCTINVNNRFFCIPSGCSLALTVPVGPVMTELLGTSDRHYWTHWQHTAFCDWQLDLCID